MKEKIFNLFVYTDGEHIDRLGVKTHEIDGTDEDKLKFLRSAVNTDFLAADISNVKSALIGTSSGNFKYSSYLALQRAGKALNIFEEIFQRNGASSSPLSCITVILNDSPAIDFPEEHGPFYVSAYEDHPKIGHGKMIDYLESYQTPNGFDIPKLIDDDYFRAIKLLFNAKHYVSAMKLIASFIDTMAYVEYGDINGCFTRWLKTYASLDRLGITENQLWELRNSILHMSNLDSRKVLSGQEKRISICVAKTGYVSPPSLEIQYFNLYDLIHELADAVSNWIETYNRMPDKMITFIERYDRVISDARLAVRNIE